MSSVTFTGQRDDQSSASGGDHGVIATVGTKLRRIDEPCIHPGEAATYDATFNASGLNYMKPGLRGR
ncbi:hypothetical protein [Bradyrhizobium sp. BR 1432]|uniref:hypothetical protein n=1 Tax=Bradyrhizobium sp. BR 1432 TaxID=3447966 RepID=UPI003EE72AAD